MKKFLLGFILATAIWLPPLIMYRNTVNYCVKVTKSIYIQYYNLAMDYLDYKEAHGENITETRKSIMNLFKNTHV